MIKKLKKNPLFKKEDVLLQGYFPSKLFARLEDLVEEKTEKVLRDKEPYLLKRYFEHHDFRIALGFAYIQALAKEMGTYSQIAPVLSLPLGSSDITVGEIAKIYQSFLDGKTYQFYSEGPKNQLSFIKKIEDRFGNTLYKAKRKEHKLVDMKITTQITEILRKTMSHGTGRLSKRYLFLKPKGIKSEILIPTFGKTGTTNDFTTSYFAGSVPYPSEFGKALNPQNNYTIAAYIGYDNNKSMQKGAQKIYGSSGAMPLWIDVVKETTHSKDYKKFIDPFDLSLISRGEWPLFKEPKTTPFLIDLPRGLILRKGKEADKDIYRHSQKNQNSYYENIFIPDRKLNSIVYLPDLSKKQKLMLFKKR